MAFKKSIIYYLVFLAVQFAFGSILRYTHPGLDNSWAQALLLAKQKGEVFGTDFVFNYGPLGYLNFKTIGPSTSKYFIFIINCFTAFNFFHFWKSLIEKFPNSKLFFSGLFLFVLIPFVSIGDFSFTYFFFFVYWLYNGISKNSYFPFIIAIVLANIIFYVKLNLNLIVIIIYSITLIIAIFESTLSNFILIGLFLFLLVSIYAFSFLLHVDLLNYIKSTFLIIDSYPDGMSELIMTKKELIFYAIIEISVFVIFINFIFKNISWTINELFFLTLILGILFLSFKQTHTAFGVLNEYGFLNFFPWIFLLMFYIIPLNQSLPQIKMHLFLVVFLVFCGHQYYWFSSSNKNFSIYVKKVYDFRPMLFRNIVDFINYDYLNHFKTNEKPLPKNLLNKIGKSTVDIFQKEIDYIFFNQLNYEHRPVIQSYQACSVELMVINSKKFQALNAPEFVIYKSSPFRRQNPMWVETPSTIELLKRYQFVNQYITKNDSLLLLQKQKLPKNVNVNYINFGQVLLNKWIQIPSDSTIMVGSFDFKYSLLGKLSRFFLQPPYLYAKVKYSNGSEGEFRVITTILKEGIILNKKITTQNELSDFFEFKGKKNLEIRAIYFYSPFQKGFVN